MAIFRIAGKGGFYEKENEDPDTACYGIFTGVCRSVHWKRRITEGTSKEKRQYISEVCEKPEYGKDGEVLRRRSGKHGNVSECDTPPEGFAPVCQKASVADQEL